LAFAPHLQRQRAGTSAMRVSPPKSFSAWAGGSAVETCPAAQEHAVRAELDGFL
jgi:hypothetical protein